MEKHVPVSPCSATVTLGTYAALWPENLDGCADAVEMLHSACWRTDVKEVVPCLHCLYRKPEKVFKPTETPLFLTVFVGLTGFEPATSCFRGVFLVGLNGFLLRLISLEKWRFLIFGCLC